MRRILAAGAAILMAALGAMILVTYVRGADQRASARALAGVKTERVLVAIAPIGKNTAADRLGTLVTLKELPRIAVPDGAVSNLADLTGKVAVADIAPGEQILKSRFADPKAVAASGDVQVPEGMQQVSVLLDAQRVVGGLVTPGSSVGVYTTTQAVADHVLVTRIETYADASAGSAKSAANQQPAPVGANSKVMVTLAVMPQQAQPLITGAQGGQIWLSLDKADVQ